MTANTPNRDAKGKFVKAPGPFCVGDRITGMTNTGRMLTGTITDDDRSNEGQRYRAQEDGQIYSIWMLDKSIRKTEDAPAKPVHSSGCLCWSGGTGWQTPDVCPVHGWRPNPDPERLAECIQERARHEKTTLAYLDGQMDKKQRDAQCDALIGHIKGKFHAALGMPGASWADLVKESATAKSMATTLGMVADARVRDLKTMTSDRDSLRIELDEAKKNSERWEQAYRTEAKERNMAQESRMVAESKLADIAAINRVSEMVSALPEGSEDWHFQGLVAGVLKGEVAA